MRRERPLQSSGPRSGLAFRPALSGLWAGHLVLQCSFTEADSNTLWISIFATDNERLIFATTYCIAEATGMGTADENFAAHILFTGLFGIARVAGNTIQAG